MRALKAADGRAESPLETLSRLLFQAEGIPTPLLQFLVLDRQGRFVARCDFGWPDFRILGEADGMAKYTTLLRPGETAADAILREKQRENALQALGWIVFRWCYDDLLNPGRLVARLRALLFRLDAA